MSVFAIIMIGGIYFLYEGLREKPEFLPPQDRWQITEVTYGDITDDVGRQYTCFRMKYLDENRVYTHMISSSQVNQFEIYHTSHDDLRFSKGNAKRFTINGYTYSINIHWEFAGESYSVELEVLPPIDSPF